MKWLPVGLMIAFAAHAIAADELHLRDGSVVVGRYAGGTAKMMYFQRTPAGTDMYPLFMVESVTFNQAPSLAPGPSEGLSPLRAPRRAPPAQQPVSVQRLAEVLATRLKWAFALLFPPPPAARFAHPAD